MRRNYDFSPRSSNPHAARLTTRVTLRLDSTTLAWFKAMAEESSIPYQTLINMYLRDCAAQKKHPRLEWREVR